MQKFKPLAFILISALILNSCKKNVGDATSQEQLYNDTETVTASVTGIVVNENNIPVPGAVVNLGIQNTTTDNYGMFRFQKIAISKNNGYVKVTKAGYFNGNRSFMATAGRTHNLRIKLLPKNITGTFSSATGGTVTLSSGSKIIFPVNAITDEADNAYSGTVNVSMTWIDPTATDLGSIIPGDLRGITTDGYERVLETYGMLGIELTNGAGQKLKIATGKTAQISLPIPAALQATAPASIPLWYFDETKGRWIQEGSATKTGSNYVGDVAHFSFWNCDLPGPMVTLCINAVNQANQPLNNILIRLRRVNNPASVSYGFTDSLGNVCGAVPINEALVLEVISPICGAVVYSQTIGPFSSNASLNIVANIPPANIITITGSLVNCSNVPVVNGYAFIYTSVGTFYNAVVVNGNFSIPVLNCAGTSISFSVIGIDNVNMQQGNPVSGSGSTGIVNVGTISACGTSISEYVNLLVNGVPYNWSAPVTDTMYSFPNPPSSGYTYAMTLAARNKTALFLNCSFSIFYNGTPGVADLQYGYLSLDQTWHGNSVAGNTVTLTEVGPFNTGFISGTITNVPYIFNAGYETRIVSGTFRVRRN